MLGTSHHERKPMIDPKAEAMFKTAAPAPATLSEYEKEQLAIQQNRERLKAERLAREFNIQLSSK
jgi:hypothetical protein